MVIGLGLADNHNDELAISCIPLRSNLLWLLPNWPARAARE
jgi:hypothetical protein